MNIIIVKRKNSYVFFPNMYMNLFLRFPCCSESYRTAPVARYEMHEQCQPVLHEHYRRHAKGNLSKLCNIIGYAIDTGQSLLTIVPD